MQDAEPLLAELEFIEAYAGTTVKLWGPAAGNKLIHALELIAQRAGEARAK